MYARWSAAQRHDHILIQKDRSVEVMISSDYVDPANKVPLCRNSKGDLCEASAPHRIVFENRDGTYDFVCQGPASDEREFFDRFYDRGSDRPFSIEECRRAWRKEPGFELLLESLGDISGKRILLLGNGISLKELYFLHLGAGCVYTDISIEAIRYIKKVFNVSEFKKHAENIEFHAVDAYHLPFQDNSFDIIYGCAFVHHLGDLDMVFSEIHRCLKPGGICRFLDHGYSPVWQFLKRTVLRPLQLYTHRKHGISPADVTATNRGGYKRMEIEHIKNAHAFREMMYVRGAFLEQILQRGTLKLGCRFLRKLKPLMRGLDNLSEWAFGFIEKNGMVLVWGFTK